MPAGSSSTMTDDAASWAELTMHDGVRGPKEERGVACAWDCKNDENCDWDACGVGLAPLSDEQRRSLLMREVLQPACPLQAHLHLPYSTPHEQAPANSSLIHHKKPSASRLGLSMCGGLNSSWPHPGHSRPSRCCPYRQR